MDRVLWLQIWPQLVEDNPETIDSKRLPPIEYNNDYDDYPVHLNRRLTSCRYVKGRYKLVSKWVQSKPTLYSNYWPTNTIKEIRIG